MIQRDQKAAQDRALAQQLMTLLQNNSLAGDWVSDVEGIEAVALDGVFNLVQVAREFRELTGSK
jgi:hypothetical protein